MSAQNEPESNEAARAARLREAINEAKRGKPGAKNPQGVTNEAAAEAARKGKARDKDDEGAGRKPQAK